MVQCETISGRRVLFVMAVEAEYGPHLRARFTPLMTGVGPIEAGIAMGAALQAFAAQTALPDLVVSLGSAGSRRCPLGEIVQVASVSWHSAPDAAGPAARAPVDRRECRGRRRL